MVVESWLHRAARTRPGGVAVEGVDDSRTYAELYAAARAGMGVLEGRGVRAGNRVAIALEPGLAFAEAFHACLLLGAVAVPVDLRLSAAERALVCADAAVVEAPLIESPVPGAAAVAAGNNEHDLDAVATVIHTSGTTSAPRPIELTYGNFLWSALGSAVALDLDPRERWLCALPVSHVGGLSILVRSAIYATTAVVHPRFDTDLVLRALREDDITLISLVATTLARLLDAGLDQPPALRYALTGGGPVPEALVQRAHEAGVPVSTTYGLTEACSQVTTGGPPLFCTRVRIAGARENGGEDVERREKDVESGGKDGEGEENEEGEILVSGPTVARASLQSDGWLHTGDLGALDGQGFLRVTGRVADTIVSGGENVAPAEVEAVLEAHPGVLEAAVLGRPDATWGEAVTAIVVPRSWSNGISGAAGAGRAAGAGGASGSDEASGAGEASEIDGVSEIGTLQLEEGFAQELRAHCATRLAGYKVPKQVDFTDTPLPRTRSGKLLRRELR
jgi:o-succinylbenzoate---CoA ligase